MKQHLHIKLLLFILHFLLIGLLPVSLYGQAKMPSIRNLDFKHQGDEIAIYFDITDCEPGSVFDVFIEVYKPDQTRILPSAISGDVGKVKPGTGKKIIWKIRQDNFSYKGNIFIDVIAKPTIKIPISKHLVKSALMPGLGNYRLGNGKMYILYGIASYSSLASSIVLNQLANQSYKDYKTSSDINQSNDLFNEAKNYNLFSKASFGIAIGIWAVNATSVYLKYQKLKKGLTPQQSKYYYNLSQNALKGRSEIKFIDTRTPYDIAFDNGKEYFQKEQYTEAQKYFEQALAINPEAIEAKQKLKDTKDIIAENINKNKRYNQNIQIGDSLYAAGQYEIAKDKYTSASIIFSDRPYPKSKINDIDKILENRRKEKEYNDRINLADAEFNNESYDKAIYYYTQALSIKPSEPYPTSRITDANKRKTDKLYLASMTSGRDAFIQKNYDVAKNYFETAQSLKPNETEPPKKILEINLILEKAKQKQVDEDYKSAITSADKAYINKEYDKAKTFYESASNLKPLESYPRGKISEINKILEIKTVEATKSEDLPSLYNKCKGSVFIVYSTTYEGVSQGSGFFIEGSGIAVTNYHVLENNPLYLCKIVTEDGKEYDIDKKLASNKNLDYVIFRIKNPSKKNFPVVKIATKLSEIGEAVFAIGNPFGFEKTLSKGIVSGYRKNNDEIQTDTPITHGSSGGPLFNSNGEVIGITTKGYESGSLYFCINIQKLPYKQYVK